MTKKDDQRAETVALDTPNPYAADEAAGTGAAAAPTDDGGSQAAQDESNARVSGDNDNRGGTRAEG